MGMNVQSGGGGNYRSRRAYRPMAEINVTPFIDVMLVLLIVFMVTAPLLNAGVQVDLPKTQASAITDKDDKPLEVSIKRDGQIYIGETEVTKDQLLVKLSAITGDDVERRIFIRADQGLAYGQVMEVLGAVNGGGYRKVALISQPAAKSK